MPSLVRLVGDNIKEGKWISLQGAVPGTDFSDFSIFILQAPVRLRQNTGCFAAIPPSAGDFRDAPWRGPCSEGKLRS